MCTWNQCTQQTSYQAHDQRETAETQQIMVSRRLIINTHKNEPAHSSEAHIQNEAKRRPRLSKRKPESPHNKLYYKEMLKRVSHGSRIPKPRSKKNETLSEKIQRKQQEVDSKQHSHNICKVLIMTIQMSASIKEKRAMQYDSGR